MVIRAWGSPAANVWPEMALMVDGRIAKSVTVGQDEPADFKFETELTAGIHEIAAAFLNDAVVGREDRNLYLAQLTIISPEGTAEPALVTRQELAEVAEQREREIVAATEAAIEKHRKADANIRIVDAEGRPVKGVRVTVEQVEHEFLFGCNIYMFDRYRNDVAERGLQAAIRGSVQLRHGRVLLAMVRITTWQTAVRIHRQGSRVVPGNTASASRDTRCYGATSRARRPGRRGNRRRRYSASVYWTSCSGITGGLSSGKWSTNRRICPNLKIDQPYRWARQADPSAYLIVNDYHVLADGCPGFLKLLMEAKQNDVPFDGIGIQAHEPRTMRFPLERVQEILDEYASLGKELHITEFTPTSSGQKISGSHRDGVWDEAAQADYAVKFYRVCFAHPDVARRGRCTRLVARRPARCARLAQPPRARPCEAASGGIRRHWRSAGRDVLRVGRRHPRRSSGAAAGRSCALRGASRLCGHAIRPVRSHGSSPALAGSGARDRIGGSLGAVVVFAVQRLTGLTGPLLWGSGAMLAYVAGSVFHARLGGFVEHRLAPAVNRRRQLLVNHEQRAAGLANEDMSARLVGRTLEAGIDTSGVAAFIRGGKGWRPGYAGRENPAFRCNLRRRLPGRWEGRPCCTWLGATFPMAPMRSCSAKQAWNWRSPWPRTASPRA